MSAPLVVWGYMPAISMCAEIVFLTVGYILIIPYLTLDAPANVAVLAVLPPVD